MIPGLTAQVVGVDLNRLRPGDQLTVVLDGWQNEELPLSLTEIKPMLSHHSDRAWIYGIDQMRRVRLVLVRSEPRDSPAVLLPYSPG